MTHYFSFLGQAKRSRYWATIAGVMAASFLCSILFEEIIVWVLPAPIVGLLLIALGIALVWLQLAVATRRCRDARISPFWSILLIVPAINLMALIILGVLPSRAGTMATAESVG